MIHAYTDEHAIEHLRPYDGKMVYAIATPTILSWKKSGMFRNIFWQVETAHQCGWDNIEFWPFNFAPARGAMAGQIPIEVVSQHQLSRKERLPDLIRKPWKVAHTIGMKHRDDSYPLMQAVLNNKEQPFPTVMYRESSSSNDFLSIPCRLLQIDPETARAWDHDWSARSSLVLFLEAARTNGFNWLTLDTHKFFRHERSVQGDASPYEDYMRSLSHLDRVGELLSIASIHLGLGRSDDCWSEEDHAWMMADIKDFIFGDEALSDEERALCKTRPLLDYLAPRGWRGLITLEAYPPVILEVLREHYGKTPTDDTFLKALQTINHTVRSIFGD